MMMADPSELLRARDSSAVLQSADLGELEHLATILEQIDCIVIKILKVLHKNTG